MKPEVGLPHVHTRHTLGGWGVVVGPTRAKEERPVSGGPLAAGRHRLDPGDACHVSPGPNEARLHGPSALARSCL